jgi:hypothetical protein
VTELEHLVRNATNTLLTQQTSGVARRQRGYMTSHFGGPKLNIAQEFGRHRLTSSSCNQLEQILLFSEALGGLRLSAPKIIEDSLERELHH